MYTEQTYIHSADNINESSTASLKNVKCKFYVSHRRAAIAVYNLCVCTDLKTAHVLTIIIAT